MVTGLDAVIGALQRLIADLARPLSEEDRRQGWTEAPQRDVCGFAFGPHGPYDD